MSNKIGLCKYCWEVLCSQCQENLIDDDNDHVSKSELRKWCEERLARVAQDRKGLRFNDDREDVMALEGMKEMLHCVLRKFCKEVS